MTMLFPSAARMFRRPTASRPSPSGSLREALPPSLTPEWLAAKRETTRLNHPEPGGPARSIAGFPIGDRVSDGAAPKRLHSSPSREYRIMLPVSTTQNRHG